MIGPFLYTMLCSSDLEYRLTVDRINDLRNTTFAVKGKDCDPYYGIAIRHFKVEPTSRLIQFDFLPGLMQSLKLEPPITGSPFEFEDVFMALEKFVDEHRLLPAKK